MPSAWNGADVSEFVRECAARQAHPIDPVMVSIAPVQEIVRIGDEVDVEELPICTYHEKDAGKYITAGLAVMRDPETGINNVGIYRHMVHEKNLLGVQLSETADGNIIWKKYEKRGLPCPIAIVIGHHPAFFIGSLCFSTLDSDEIRIAGGMLQRPVPLVPLQDHPARRAGRCRDRAGMRNSPGRATRRGAVRRISRAPTVRGG